MKVTSPWQGGQRIWSCGFHFDGSDPTDAEWEVLADTVRDAFKECLIANVQIIESIGYDASSDISVFSRDEATDGVLAGSGSETQLPLEVAALIRWATAARSTKGHPVYLFNYVHGPLSDGGSNRELIASAQLSALATFADHWVTGMSDGTGVRHRAGPNGATAVSSHIASEVTHRDFPR